MSLIKKTIQFFKYIRFWKDGGVTRLRVAQISYPGLLEGKKIIITGGSSGIGLAMAQKFLSLGAEVLITGRNEERLKAVLAKENNPHLRILQWDVANLEVMEPRFDEAVLSLGGCDIVVNNAAYVARKQTDVEFYDKMMDTNMRAVYFMCKHAAEFFIKKNDADGGKILNISSLSAQISSTNPYSISKTGVDAITRSFAKEYAARNIIVNGIAPG